MSTRRRQLLAAIGAAGVGTIAGCSDGVEGERAVDGDDEPPSIQSESIGGPPLADTRLHMAYESSVLREKSINGGVSKDGIPSIDDPKFAPASDVTLRDDVPVFGLVRNGEVRAYPQSILVWHEIVNDTLGDEPVAVTYCPLTGTAQGFERGETTFGVSGDLVNSNLIMYDRGTDSRWPQILATASDGELRGASLREFRLVWTTWARWRDAHPNTMVLTEDTGFARRYTDDPYGSYAPRRGYYASDNTMFAPLAEDDRESAKTVVLGARTDEGAIAFNKDRLLESRVLEGTLAGRAVLAVADPRLATGYVYAHPSDVTVQPDGTDYQVTGADEPRPAGELPLDRILSFDAMWFAWAGFYPDTTYVE